MMMTVSRPDFDNSLTEQGQKRFWSTSTSCKGIRDSSSAQKLSPITSVKRQVLIIHYAKIHESLEAKKVKKVIPTSMSLARAPT